MRTFHRYLVAEDRRPDDPTVDVEGVRVPAGLPKPLTEAEVVSLLDVVTGSDPVARRDRALLELLYATGARISEACGLSSGDIDFDSRLVRLFGKGSKERIVPFGRAAAAALDEWFAPDGRLALVPAQWRRRNDAEAVFLNARGGRLSRQAAWAVVRRHGGGPGYVICRRTSCATRAPRTCSITAPTCASCRSCSVTPRSRRRRCTRRSARSGCSTCIAPPIRALLRHDDFPLGAPLRHIALPAATVAGR